MMLFTNEKDAGFNQQIVSRTRGQKRINLRAALDSNTSSQAAVQMTFGELARAYLAVHYNGADMQQMINNTKSSAKKFAKTLFFITTVAAATSSFAADGFRTHFATAGSLGENIFTSEIKPGGFAGLGYKKAVAEALTDSSGNEIKKASNGLPLTYKNTASVQYIYAGYTADEDYAGGKLSGVITVPFTTFDKKVSLTHPQAGSLNVPNSSGDVSGLDDLEIGGSWDYKKSADTKYSVGLGLTTKTGGYQVTSNGASIGQGYYTLKPSFSSITQDGAMSYAYKATLGLNSTNSEANYRSGNVLSLEAAIGYKTSVGAFGFRVHKLEQIQDDSGTAMRPT